MTRLAAPLLLLPALAAAADVAVLHNGARIPAARIESAGQTFILHQGAGRIELDATLVASIEHIDEPAAPPASSPAPPPAPPPVRDLVTESALRHGLPPAIVHALAQTESGYRPDAVSPKGAIGVMQLMPATAASLGADPSDPVQNIEAGARLLRDLLLKYQNAPDPVRRALAAYNAGPAAVDRFGGVPPYRETRSYVEKVIQHYWRQTGSQPHRP